MAHNCIPSECPECAPDLALLVASGDPWQRIADPDRYGRYQIVLDGQTVDHAVLKRREQ